MIRWLRVYVFWVALAVIDNTQAAGELADTVDAGLDDDDHHHSHDYHSDSPDHPKTMTVPPVPRNPHVGGKSMRFFLCRDAGVVQDKQGWLENRARCISIAERQWLTQ